MGKSVNKIFILGNAGCDAEAMVTKTGKSMSSFRVATNEMYKNDLTVDLFCFNCFLCP